MERTVIVITGGSRGIGRAAAERLAGGDVDLVLAARDPRALETSARACRARGASVRTVVTDVADPAQNRALVAAAVEAFGRIDVWIGAAGVVAYGSVDGTPDDIWERVVDVNLLGTIHGVRAVLPQFRAQGAGRIVLVSSLYSVVWAAHMSAYVASKFGVTGFSRALRQELLGESIDVRTVLPATIDTAIYQRAANVTGRSPHPLPPVTSPHRVARAIARAAAGRGPREVFVGRLQSWAAPIARLVPAAYDRGMRVAMETAGLRGGGVTPTAGAVLDPRHDDGSVDGGWRSGVLRRILAGLGILGVLGVVGVRAGRRRRDAHTPVKPSR